MGNLGDLQGVLEMRAGLIIPLMSVVVIMLVLEFSIGHGAG